MKKALAILGLLGLVFQLTFIPTVKAQSMTINCPTGAAVPISPWVQTGKVISPQPQLMCPTPTGAAAPIMVPVETKKPWWKFWERKKVECKATCPCYTPVYQAPTGGAACPTPRIIRREMPAPPVRREPVRGYW